METKKSFLVLTPPGVNEGFRLGGAPVARVFDEASLNGAIETAIEKGEVGILAVPEDMRELISDKNRKSLQRSVFPLVVFYGYPSKWEEPFEIEEEVEMMVERAVGYRLRIRL